VKFAFPRQKHIFKKFATKKFLDPLPYTPDGQFHSTFN